MAVQKKKQQTALAEAGAPHRVRLTVPAEDAVTMQWLAAQSSVSASLRVLIREAMMQHGPIDALSRPLPTMPAQVAPTPAPVPVQPAPVQTEASAPELVSDEPAQQAPARLVRRTRPTPAPVAAVPAPVVEPEASASGISDIAAFMAASRDDD